MAASGYRAIGRARGLNIERSGRICLRQPLIAGTSLLRTGLASRRRCL
jgi:hypothetical protein